ncbi:MAG: TonB-dependent receptor plug domain-containing protein [Gemmatimonadetes bacterium]|nr:TonB-dependent receptor plug domain-containing protein [Gemmatimonadota bacterium]
MIAIRTAGIHASVVAATWLSLAPFRLTCQTVRIEGTVEDGITGARVSGARILLVGTPRETRTDRAGTYRLADIPVGRLTLRVEAERYAAMVQDLTIDSASTLVVLPLTVEPLAIVLDRLQARAAGGQRANAGSPRRTSGELSGAGRPAEQLTARVPGARILFTGGSVGTATQILLRGAKSLSLSGEPLYYVDGVQVSPPTAPTARNRAGEPSILDLIDPSTIERIEVLSGPAASAAFGLGSNNGVILIYTKH